MDAELCIDSYIMRRQVRLSNAVAVSNCCAWRTTLLTNWSFLSHVPIYCMISLMIGTCSEGNVELIYNMSFQISFPTPRRLCRQFRQNVLKGPVRLTSSLPRIFNLFIPHTAHTYSNTLCTYSSNSIMQVARSYQPSMCHAFFAVMAHAFIIVYISLSPVYTRPRYLNSEMFLSGLPIYYSASQVSSAGQPLVSNFIFLILPMRPFS